MTTPSYPPFAIPEKLSKCASGFSIVLSILLIVCGVLTILLPFEMSLGVVLLVSWLLIIGGIVQFVHLWCNKITRSRCLSGVGDRWPSLRVPWTSLAPAEFC